MTDKERAPLSGKEYAALQTLFGMVSAWANDRSAGVLEKRAKAAGIWDEVEQIETLCAKVMVGLFDTIPAKKLQHIKMDLKNTQILIRVTPPGMSALPEMKSYCYVPTYALNSALNHICQTECALCDKTDAESRKCEFRKTLDGALPHAVGKDESGHCRYSDLVLGLTVEDE